MNRMYFTPAWMLASIWVMSPTFSSLPVGGHDLHHADRANRALDVLVQRRLLVALRRHQQVVDVVLRAVLLEQLDHRLELLALGVGRGVLRVLDVLEIAAFDRVSERVALSVLPEPRVDGLPELGILLAKRDGQVCRRTARRRPGAP